METIIHNLGEIIKAMNTLQLTGYNQCKTYTNIIESIELTKNLAIHIQEENNEKEKLKKDKDKESKNKEE